MLYEVGSFKRKQFFEEVGKSVIGNDEGMD
jgi:hypothetical protein